MFREDANDEGLKDCLLATIGPYIRLKNLRQMALIDLEITSVEYDNIIFEEDNTQNRAFNVLEKWRNGKSVKYDDLMKLLQKWEKQSYVDHKVWEACGISPPPSPVPDAPCPAPRSNSRLCCCFPRQISYYFPTFGEKKKGPKGFKD